VEEVVVPGEGGAVMVMFSLSFLAMVTPPLRLQQPAPKPSIVPSDSDSQHSFTYLWKSSESFTLISLISVAKSEFSRDFAYPTT
jgi:hypothetical protein